MMDNLMILNSKDEYENRFEQFLQFTKCNAESLGGEFFCPCVKER